MDNASLVDRSTYRFHPMRRTERLRQELFVIDAVAQQRIVADVGKTMDQMDDVLNHIEIRHLSKDPRRRPDEDENETNRSLEFDLVALLLMRLNHETEVSTDLLDDQTADRLQRRTTMG